MTVFVLLCWLKTEVCCRRTSSALFNIFNPTHILHLKCYKWMAKWSNCIFQMRNQWTFSTWMWCSSTTTLCLAADYAWFLFFCLFCLFLVFFKPTPVEKNWKWRQTSVCWPRKKYLCYNGWSVIRGCINFKVCNTWAAHFTLKRNDWIYLSVMFMNAVLSCVEQCSSEHSWQHVALALVRCNFSSLSLHD